MDRTGDPKALSFRDRILRALYFTLAIKVRSQASRKHRLTKTGSQKTGSQKRGRLGGGLFPHDVRTYLSNQNQSACARRQSALRCSLRPIRMPNRTQAFRSPLSQSGWKPIISASTAFCAWAGEATIEADPPTPAAITKAVINRLKVMGSPVKTMRIPRTKA